MITKSLLSKIIKTGNLTWVMPNGEINTYGDGTGEPIKIRTTNNFSEIKLLTNPSIHFGESYMNGSLVVEEGRIHDFLKLIYNLVKKDSFIFISTDWEDYANSIEESIVSSRKYTNEEISLEGLQKTKYQIKADKEGRKIFSYFLRTIK